MVKKHRAKNVLALLSAAVIAVGMLPAPALAQSTRSAKIYSATGSVSVKRGGDKLLPAFEGMRLEEGDIIIASTDSSAVIEIDADKTVSVDENTEIALSTLAGDAGRSQTGISVFFGNIVNSIQNKLSKGSTFETETPTAIMGVRGTTYLVGQPLAQPPSVVVSSGSVQTDTEKGSAMVDPGFVYEALSEAPEPVSVEKLVSYGPVAVSALANDKLVESLQNSGASVTNISDLVSAAQEERAQQHLLAAQPAAEAAPQQEESYFFDTGAKLAGTVAAQVEPESTAAPTPDTPAETASPPQETTPAPQETAAAEVPGASPAPDGILSNTTANGFNDSKTAASASTNVESASNAQKDTSSKTPPSFSGGSSDRNDSSNNNESSGSSGGGGSNGGGNTDNWPKPLPQMPSVTNLSAVLNEQALDISWDAIHTASVYHVTLTFKNNEKKVFYPINVSTVGNKSTYKIPLIKLQGWDGEDCKSVTVITKGNGITTRDSAPVTFTFNDDNEGNPDGLPKISGFSAKINGGSLILNWDSVTEATSYQVWLTPAEGGSQVDESSHLTSMGPDGGTQEWTLSLDEAKKYKKAVEVVAMHDHDAISQRTAYKFDHIDYNSPDGSNGSDGSGDSDDSADSDSPSTGYIRELKAKRNNDKIEISWKCSGCKDFEVYLIKGQPASDNLYSSDKVKIDGEKYKLEVDDDALATEVIVYFVVSSTGERLLKTVEFE